MCYSENAVTVCDHPLIKHKLTMIRDKHTGTNQFRTIVAELAMLVIRKILFGSVLCVIR